MRALPFRACPLLVLLLISPIANCAEPVTRWPVVCWPIVRDDSDEEEANVPESPRPVVLMVKGKFVRPAGQKEPKNDGFDREPERIELHVEEVLFGPDPGQVVPFWADSFGYWHTLDQSYYYAFVCIEEKGKLYFDIDNYFFHRRSEPLTDRRAFEAIAAARMDYHVLGSEAIFIGKPGKSTAAAPAEKPAETTGNFPADIRGFHLKRFGDGRVTPINQEVVIEKVLVGDLKPGEQIAVRIERPVPLLGNDSQIYFATKYGPKFATCKFSWDLGQLNKVTASLARRPLHPVKEGKQQIVYLGTAAEATELLGSHSRIAQRLAKVRLESLGDSQVPTLAAAIEANLFRAELNYEQQKRMIDSLSKQEKQRTDGEIVRLTNLMLKRAEAGESFPVPPPLKTDDELAAFAVRAERRAKLHYHLQRGNHSLAWLIQSLKPADAARLYCERLKKLRDLTAYGWKEEATGLLEVLHLEDHLALPPLLAQSAPFKPITWQAQAWPPAVAAEKLAPKPAPAAATKPAVDPFGDAPAAPADPFRSPFDSRPEKEQLDVFEFSRDGQELIARSQYGGENVWNPQTGQLIRSRAGVLSNRFWSPGRRTPTSAVAEDGSTWTMVAREQPYKYAGERYGPPAAAAIVVTPRNQEVRYEDSFDDDQPIMGARGQVRLFGYQDDPPFGLLGGGRFHIGTNIFDRQELKPVSVANVLGEIVDLQADAAGNRYALLTHLTDWQADYVVRLHDVATGVTLQAWLVKEHVERLAFAPNGQHLAVITRDSKILTWRIGK